VYFPKAGSGSGHLLHLFEQPGRIKADRFGKFDEFDHVYTPLTTLQRSYERLVTAQSACDLRLAQPGALAYQAARLHSNPQEALWSTEAIYLAKRGDEPEKREAHVRH
jgi:hypothetical protein